MSEREALDPAIRGLIGLVTRAVPGDPPELAELPPLGAAAAPGSRPRARRWLAAGTFFAVTATAAVVLAPRFQTARALLTYEVQAGERRHDGTIVAKTIAARFRFSDGTLLELAPGAEGRVAEVMRDGATFLVAHGRVVVAKTGGGDRWSLRAGPYAVQVLGSRFEVAWRPYDQIFELVVQDGQPRVTGPLLGDGAFVQAGHRLVARVADGDVRISAIVNVPERPRVAPQPAVPLPMDEPAEERRPKPRRAEAPRSIAALVAIGDWPGALAQAERAGVPRLLASASSDELAALADAARYAHRPALAQRALEATRRRFAGSRAAAEAAFALGRQAEDVDHDPRLAARWFERYRRELPDGRFAPESLGRQLAALDRSGDAAGARALAADYLARFPGGPYASVAARIVAARATRP